MDNVKEILKNIPLRISITDYCNLNCFFCSNEGMDLNFKNKSKADVSKLIYLVRLLHKEGLENISITGGEPSCYKELKELLNEINVLGFKKSFFHTNAVSLSEELIKGPLKEFSKVAVSIHSVDFDEWKSMTGGTRAQFDNLMGNLNLLSKEGYADKVEIKIVPIKGYNFSRESIEGVLDFCNENGFRFKFLVFEPIKKEHLGLIIGIDKVSSILEGLGADRLSKDEKFRNQSEYLPINKYRYKSTEGVLIEIGCGKKEVCRSCSKSNELFITPSLKIKPCHISPFKISLDESISKGDEKEILGKIVESRRFLKRSPGENKQYWGEE